MILKIQKNMKKVALILVFFMLMMSSDFVLLNAEEENEEFRSCEEALKACVEESLIFIFINPVNALICLAGWAFCKKYVEKHIKN